MTFGWERDDQQSPVFLGNLCVGRVWFSDDKWHTKRYMSHVRGEFLSRLEAQEALAAEIADLIGGG
jgi:hypothetical protein